MRRYYFHLYESGVALADNEGLELLSLEAAVEVAMRSARSIIADDVAEGRICLDCFIQISDSHGIPIWSVDFAEAVDLEPRLKLGVK